MGKVEKSLFDTCKNQKEAPRYGANVLRLWVSSVDYSGDVIIGPQIVKKMSSIYKKLCVEH